MRAVVLKLTCSVEMLTKKKFTPAKVKASVKEAIEEALYHAESHGFNHGLSDDISIVVTGVNA